MMILFYLRSGLRIIRRNPVLSIIKTSGLALGLATFLLLTLFAAHELRYDRQHPGSDRIHRYIHRVKTPEGLQNFSFASATIAPALKERYPEVESYNRMLVFALSVRNPTNDLGFNEKKFMFADSNFFEFFHFPRSGGHGAFDDPFSVILTPASAQKYFGNENPVGKSLVVNGKLDFVVTGVLTSDPNFTHLKFDFLTPLATLEAIRNIPAAAAQIPASMNIDKKGFAAFYTYLKLAPGSTAGELESKFPSFIEGFRGKEYTERLKPWLQSLHSIHLESNLLYEMDQNGSKNTVVIFFVIGIAILLIACINYVNLSTAEFMNRARSVGLKKILGVRNGTLLFSHLLESGLLSLTAIATGTLCAYLFLPVFELMVNRQIEFFDSRLTIFLPAVWAGTTLVAGLYPSIAITRIATLEAFKGELRRRPGFFSLRNALVFFQVLVSFCLVSLTLLVFVQLNFLLDKDLGFAANRIIAINATGSSVQDRESFKVSALSTPGIVGIAGCTTLPGGLYFSMGLTLPESDDQERRISTYHTFVDGDFLNTMGIRLREGRFFEELNPADSNSYMVVSESLAEILTENRKSPISRELEIPDIYSGKKNKKAVLGIVSDFHFKSLHSAIEPMLYEYNPRRINHLLVRFEAGSERSVLSSIEGKWKDIMPFQPFDYSFLDEGMKRLYVNELRLEGVILTLAALAIGLAALGLFGSTLFTVQQRTREIGIRKVLGSERQQLFLLLLRPISILILVSCVIGIPMAYAGGEKWLSQFPYRVAISPVIFVAAFAGILTVIVLSLVYHFVRVNRINPVQVLREH